MENIRDLQHWTSALHRNGKPSGVIEAGRHCLPHAVCRTAVQESRGHRECVEFDRERNSPFFNRFSAGTGLVTDALDSCAKLHRDFWIYCINPWNLR